MNQHKQYPNPIAKNFLPTTRKEMDKLGWKQCDVILVSGDAYKEQKDFVKKSIHATPFKILPLLT